MVPKTRNVNKMSDNIIYLFHFSGICLNVAACEEAAPVSIPSASACRLQNVALLFDFVLQREAYL